MNFTGGGGACQHEEMTNSWMRSDCPICGQSFPHKKGYQPMTCGRFDCLQEANRRGMLPSRRIPIDPLWGVTKEKLQELK